MTPVNHMVESCLFARLADTSGLLLHLLMTVLLPVMMKVHMHLWNQILNSFCQPLLSSSHRFQNQNTVVRIISRQ